MNADEIVRVLRSYSQSLVGYKLGCEFADAVENGASLIESLQAQLAERDKELKRLQKEVASLAIESIEREKTLAKLEAEVMVWAKAERDGRLVVLPCKVGEYWARDGKRYIVAEISVTSAWGIMVRHYEEGNGKMLSCNPQYFAKHYTRAEAEAALKEAQHE